MGKKINTFSYCGLALFGFNNWDIMEIDQFLYYDVQWELPSMQKYNGCGVYLSIDGTMGFSDSEGKDIKSPVKTIIDIEEIQDLLKHKK